MFRDIVAVIADDGITFAARDVRAVESDHDDDGYDGVKVFVRALVEKRNLDIRIDIGFGDAVVPPASRMSLTPFLDDDEPAAVLAYDAHPVIAEKVETLLSKFPVVLHRLKDILDVVTLSKAQRFAGADLADSLRATLERRSTEPDTRVLDDMSEVVGDRKWETAWASMLREKAVVDPMELAAAIDELDRFIRPILLALSGDVVVPDIWEDGGPWQSRSEM